jgi:DNA invertase Pin-like site-specific DNA recombinase
MKPKGPTVRAVLYCRVSKEQARTSGVTLEAQEARLRAYCISLGLEVAAVVKDDGVSGAAPFADRPAGAQVRELFLAGACNLAKGQRRGAPSHLVAAKLDRFGRDTADLLSTVREYQGAGVAVHTSDEGGLVESLENDDAELLLTIRAAFASHERRKISVRTKAALAYKKSQGLRTGTIPLGKRLAADGKHLEDNPAELEAVEKIRANAHRHAEILEELEAVRARLAEFRALRDQTGGELELEESRFVAEGSFDEFGEPLDLRPALRALKSATERQAENLRRLREEKKRELALIKEKKATSYLGTARELNARIGDLYPTRNAKAWSERLVRQFVEGR